MPQTVTNPKIAANNLIESLLASLLDTAPGASLASLNLIEIGGSRMSVSRPRLGAAKIIGSRQHPSNMISENQAPLDWELFLPALHAGRSLLVRVADLGASPMRECLRSIDVSKFLLFPVVGSHAGVLGAVSTMWTTSNRAPTRTGLSSLIARGSRAAGQIAVVMDLCEWMSARRASPTSADIVG
jgi:hypothetical protein